MVLLHSWLYSRGRIACEQREIGCRCQEPIHFNSLSVRHGYLFICSFLVGFCLGFIRQLISPVSLKQESIRFKQACMLCISPLSVLCDWEDKHHAYRTHTPNPSLHPPRYMEDVNTNMQAHTSIFTRELSKDLGEITISQCRKPKTTILAKNDFLCFVFVYTLFILFWGSESVGFCQ